MGAIERRMIQSPLVVRRCLPGREQRPNPNDRTTAGMRRKVVAAADPGLTATASAGS
jgi:hypothetical protein